ncbi:FecR family protein [Larkinella rosea]|uniref:FecR family protein n=1 Tax=Larkinella rosea TaxID=2025312 RepID=A0A3P1C2Q6_9BACT|nr:FecR family protein [Larkinella rosea]RRB07084.1 FecR family protein [Larkinella rosea]
MGLLDEDLSSVDDFLGNEAFRTWVTERRPEDQALWQTWLTLHPERKEIYEEAVATFWVIRGKTVAITQEEIRDKTADILDQLPASSARRLLFPKPWGQWLSAAAVVGLLVWWQLGKTVFQPTAVNQTGDGKTIPAEIWQLVKNTSDKSRVVLLPDQSSVLLSSGSQLRFRKQMTAGLREVFLEGEGFFEVTKNPARPFVVYTHNLTTKVLGTSFLVRSFDREKTAFVKVKTGNVMVSAVKSPEKPVLLTVNEEVKVNAQSGPVVKRKSPPAEEPAFAPVTQHYVFRYKPVTEIFDQLEAGYHMPIQYERDVLKNCTFTGQLNDVPFLEKVRLICLTIESTYELVDNRVIIHSRSCD